jgi:glycosyltransferase involved in cell wall biosynthesis
MPFSNNDLVSVVIPCYKQAMYLGKAIESVQAQTYKRYEIIVINDGSPDNPDEVVKQYPDVRYLHQTNQGVSKTRNRGLRESQGAYVVFLDADDHLLPNHFQAGVSAFQKTPEVGCVQGAYNWCTSDYKRYVHNCDYKLDHFGTLLFHSIALSAVMWRRDVVMELGGFRDFRRGQDVDLHIRLAQAYPITCHHELIAEYQHYDRSLNWAASLESVMQMYQSHRDYIRKHRQYEPLFQKALAYLREEFGDRLVWEMGMAARAGEMTRCARCFWVLLRFYPKGLANHMWGVFSRRLSQAGNKSS